MLLIIFHSDKDRFLINFLAFAMLIATVTVAAAGEMSAACTLHGGVVFCFEVSGSSQIADDGPCYAAQKQVVKAQNYAPINSGKPEIIANKMRDATDKLFKECASFQASDSASPPQTA